MVLEPNRPSSAAQPSVSLRNPVKRLGDGIARLRAAGARHRALAPAVLLPAAAFIAGVTLDLSLAFRSHGHMQTVARDAARLVAVGQATIAQAETYALSRLPGPASYSIMVAERPSEHGAPDILVAISTASDGIGLFGALRLFDVERLTARHATRMEAVDQVRCGEPCASDEGRRGG
ncbi:MAG: hypothetical protein AAF676_17230 [Pseudomonadota bacterium]